MTSQGRRTDVEENVSKALRFQITELWGIEHLSSNYMEAK